MEKDMKNQANLLVKECLVTALIRLVREKPLSSITVSELAKRAGVSRMSFYRNYNSKEDIFVDHLWDILDEYKKEAIRDQNHFYDLENLRQCFFYFEKHREFLESLFLSGMSHLLLKSLSEYMTETWLKAENGKKRFYILQAFAGSLYNTFVAWAINGYQETTDELASIIHEVYRSSVTDSL